jgi:hypothetical protein
MSLPDPNATANLITEPFGSGAANPTYITLPIPVPSQITSVVNQASFTDGFPPSTMTPEASGGLPFFGQDMNGILYMMSANIAALAAGDLPVYNAARSAAIGGYPAGALVQMANNNGYWLSIAAGNTTDPDTGGAGWRAVTTTGEVVITLSSGTVNLTAVEAAFPLIAFNGTLTGNVIVNFPANAGQMWIVAAYTAGAFTITLQTAAAGNTVALVSGSGYSNAQNVFSDGINLWSNNVSTAGLAPIASPALTGTPTAPTAATSSNTTQIATTAFTKAAIAAALSGYALLASPTFSGVPTAPTPATSDNSAKLATTAFVQALAGISAVASVNGGLNFAVGIQVRWGIVSHTVIGNQAHAFSTPFTHGCYVVIPVVAGSPGVEFFTVISGSETASGWTQYSNNTTNINYIAIGF